jgi:hypothetical protein
MTPTIPGFTITESTPLEIGPTVTSYIIQTKTQTIETERPSTEKIMTVTQTHIGRMENFTTLGEQTSPYSQTTLLPEETSPVAPGKETGKPATEIPTTLPTGRITIPQETESVITHTEMLTTHIETTILPTITSPETVSPEQVTTTQSPVTEHPSESPATQTTEPYAETTEVSVRKLSSETPVTQTGGLTTSKVATEISEISSAGTTNVPFSGQSVLISVATTEKPQEGSTSASTETKKEQSVTVTESGIVTYITEPIQPSSKIPSFSLTQFPNISSTSKSENATEPIYISEFTTQSAETQKTFTAPVSMKITTPEISIEVTVPEEEPTGLSSEAASTTKSPYTEGVTAVRTTAREGRTGTPGTTASFYTYPSLSEASTLALSTTETKPGIETTTFVLSSISGSVTTEYGTTVGVTEMPSEKPHIPVKETSGTTTSISFTGVTEVITEEIPTVRPIGIPTEKLTTIPTEGPAGTSTEQLTEVITERFTEIHTEGPEVTPTERTSQRLTTRPAETPTKGPVEIHKEKITEIYTEGTTRIPTEATTGIPTEKQTGIPTEGTTGVPTERATWIVTEGPTGIPKERTTGKLTEGPTEMFTETATERPARIPTERTTQMLTGGPTEVSTEGQTERPTGMSTAKTTQILTERPTKIYGERTTLIQTERATEIPTEWPTRIPTERTTQILTERPTEIPTEGSTRIPTERTTQILSERPTEIPTGEPTRILTGRTTQILTERPTGGTAVVFTTTEMSPTSGTAQSPTVAPTGGATEVSSSSFGGTTEVLTKAPFTTETPVGITAETITEVFPTTISRQITHTDITLTTIVPSTTFLFPTTKQTNRTCVGDADCPPSEACRCSQCVNPCAESNNGCAHNALCTVLNHIILCTCPSGHTGDATKDCQGIFYSHSHTHAIAQKHFICN